MRLILETIPKKTVSTVRTLKDSKVVEKITKSIKKRDINNKSIKSFKIIVKSC